MRGLERFRRTISTHIADLERAHALWEERRTMLADLRTAIVQRDMTRALDLSERLCAWKSSMPSIVKSVELYRKALRAVDEAEADADQADLIAVELADEVDALRAAAGGWMRLAGVSYGDVMNPPPPLPANARAVGSFASFEDAPRLTLIFVPEEMTPMPDRAAYSPGRALDEARRLLTTPGHTVFAVKSIDTLHAIQAVYCGGGVQPIKVLLVMKTPDGVMEFFLASNGAVPYDFWSCFLSLSRRGTA